MSKSTAKHSDGRKRRQLIRENLPETSRYIVDKKQWKNPSHKEIASTDKVARATLPPRFGNTGLQPLDIVKQEGMYICPATECESQMKRKDGIFQHYQVHHAKSLLITCKFGCMDKEYNSIENVELHYANCTAGNSFENL